MPINLLLKTLFLFSAVVLAAPVSRVTNFSDGNILTAAELNNEFNNLISGINSINNDQIASAANIAPSKISSTIDGDGIIRDGTTGALSVNDDNVTLEIASDLVQVKDNGISNAKLRQSSGLSVIGRSANSTGNVADITAASDNQVLRRSGTSIGFGTITQSSMGSLGQQTAEIGSAFTTTSTSMVDITGLSVSLTTSGRPVMILYTASSGCTSGYGASNNSSNATLFAYMTATRNGSTVGSEVPCGNVFPSTSVNNQVQCPASLVFFDAPAAGTYTYRLQLRSIAAFTTANACGKLVVYEL